MHRHDFFGRNAVAVDDDVARQIRHGHHSIGGHHTRPLDGVGLRVDVLAAAVVFRGVHVHDQRFSRDTFSGYSCVVGEPVVGVDDVKLTLQFFGHLRGHHSVTGDLLHQIRAVLARERITLFPCVGRRPYRPARFDVLFVVFLVLLGRDVRNHVRVDVDERHFRQNVVGIAARRSVECVDVAGIDDMDETLIFVSVGVRHDERNIDAIAGQTAGHPVAGRSQSARDMGREFPTEH